MHPDYIKIMAEYNSAEAAYVQALKNEKLAVSRARKRTSRAKDAMEKARAVFVRMSDDAARIGLTVDRHSVPVTTDPMPRKRPVLNRATCLDDLPDRFSIPEFMRAFRGQSAKEFLDRQIAEGKIVRSGQDWVKA